ncbi:transcriptional regulator [Caldalkalibacillus thermarum]|uniref:ArsR/SmtB family transcription factor n=1 Tax=Caldalkalibacillus thermarum TaxID=296745 RepID=UPI00166D4905|nr:metalloregulator ArsR/SmtB family transcription factor [Caldalkalibacillus thermarum]GGK21731.1 transcriptional regulator [Caldalkalibacillus thermarum]
MEEKSIISKRGIGIKISKTKQDDTCETFIFDPEKVARRQQEVDRTEGLAPLFKVLADETRLKIIYALSREDELCVCDVATIIGSTNAAASHHLRMLRNMGLAKHRKEGKMVFYSLESGHVRHLIDEALRLKERR